MPERRTYDWEYDYEHDANRTADNRARDERRNRAAEEDSRDDPWLTGYGGGPGASTTGDGRSTSGSAGGNVNQLDRDLANIPIIGGWSRDKIAMEQDAWEADRNRQVWRDVSGSAPSVDTLTPETFLEGDTDEYGNLIGGPSQLEGFGPSGDQGASLEALRGLYESGGYTDADRNMSRVLRDQQGMQLGAANQAALQGMQTRGMGGSGAELAMRMGAGDSMAAANSSADAQLQQAAMQRALQSLQGWQSGSNTVQQQELARRGALDAYNQSNDDWRRGRESRNTQLANQGSRDRTAAQQQAYENRERVAAGMTNQYSTDVGGRNSNRDRSDARDGQAAQFLGGILDF
jgi:hypothetical protein